MTWTNIIFCAVVISFVMRILRKPMADFSDGVLARLERWVAREIRKLAAANEILRGTTKALPKDITKMSESGASIELADYVRAVMGLQPNHGATLPKLLLGVFKAWLTAKLKKISKSPASS